MYRYVQPLHISQEAKAGGAGADSGEDDDVVLTALHGVNRGDGARQRSYGQRGADRCKLRGVEGHDSDTMQSHGRHCRSTAEAANDVDYGGGLVRVGSGYAAATMLGAIHSDHHDWNRHALMAVLSAQAAAVGQVGDHVSKHGRVAKLCVEQPITDQVGSIRAISLIQITEPRYERTAVEGTRRGGHRKRWQLSRVSYQSQTSRAMEERVEDIWLQGGAVLIEDGHFEAKARCRPHRTVNPQASTVSSQSLRDILGA